MDLDGTVPQGGSAIRVGLRPSRKPLYAEAESAAYGPKGITHASYAGAGTPLIGARVTSCRLYRLA